MDTPDRESGDSAQSSAAAAIVGAVHSAADVSERGAAAARRTDAAAPLLCAEAWAAALSARLLQKTLQSNRPLNGEAMLITPAPSGLSGVQAVVGASANLSVESLPAHVQAMADAALSEPVTGTLTTAVATADRLALMDRRVALSPMPIARLVFHPQTSDTMYLVSS